MAYKKPKNRVSTVAVHAVPKAKAPHVGKPKLPKAKTGGGVVYTRGGAPTGKKPNTVIESHIVPTPEKKAAPHIRGGVVKRSGGHPTGTKPNPFVRANSKKKTPVKGHHMVSK